MMTSRKSRTGCRLRPVQSGQTRGRGAVASHVPTFGTRSVRQRFTGGPPVNRSSSWAGINSGSAKARAALCQMTIRLEPIDLGETWYDGRPVPAEERTEGGAMRITRLTTVAAAAAVALAMGACGRSAAPTPAAGTGTDTRAGAGDKCTSSGTTFTPASHVSIPGSPTFTRIASTGRVVVGVKADQPNLGYKDADGTRCGFDIEMAQLIAAKLGIDPSRIEYKEIASANRETAIKS